MLTTAFLYVIAICFVSKIPKFSAYSLRFLASYQYFHFNTPYQDHTRFELIP